MDDDPIQPEPADSTGAGGTLPRPRRTAWKSLVYGAVLLICGTVIGGGLTFRYAVAKMRAEQEQPPPMFRPDFYRKISRELDLTDEQQDEMRRIFRQSHEAVGEIRKNARSQLSREFSLMRREVEAVLTPEQLKNWDARIEHIRKRLRNLERRDRDGDGERTRRDGPRRDGRWDGPRRDGSRDDDSWKENRERKIEGQESEQPPPLAPPLQ